MLLTGHQGQSLGTDHCQGKGGREAKWMVHMLAGQSTEVPVSSGNWKQGQQ